MENTRLPVDISFCGRCMFLVPKAIRLVVDMSDRPDDNCNYLDGFGESVDCTNAARLDACRRLRRCSDADHPIPRETPFLKSAHHSWEKNAKHQTSYPCKQSAPVMSVEEYARLLVRRHEMKKENSGRAMLEGMLQAYMKGQMEAGVNAFRVGDTCICLSSKRNRTSIDPGKIFDKLMSIDEFDKNSLAQIVGRIVSTEDSVKFFVKEDQSLLSTAVVDPTVSTMWADIASMKANENSDLQQQRKELNAQLKEAEESASADLEGKTTVVKLEEHTVFFQSMRVESKLSQATIKQAVSDATSEIVRRNNGGSNAEQIVRDIMISFNEKCKHAKENVEKFQLKSLVIRS